MPQALLLLLLLCIPAFAQKGKVVGVTDGDTITVLSNQEQIKVRMAGIDAPEKGQPYSDTAKRFLAKLVFGKSVRLEGTKLDRYGRLVAKVLRDGNDVNLTMIEFGLAWHFTKYENEQSKLDRDKYSKAEAAARKNRIFLWSDKDPVPPWDYRAGQASKASVTPKPRLFPLVSRPIYQSSSGQIIGNQNSKIFHLPGCPSYDKVAAHNRVYFTTAQEAQRAGYRMAKNC